jgi:hypothetical protein
MAKGYDISDNVPLYGYLDFGFLGAFFSGIFQAIMLVIFQVMIFSFHKINPILGLSTLSTVIFNHASLEYPYGSELGILRDFIILYILTWSIAFGLKIFGK